MAHVHTSCNFTCIFSLWHLHLIKWLHISKIFCLVFLIFFRLLYLLTSSGSLNMFLHGGCLSLQSGDSKGKLNNYLAKLSLTVLQCKNCCSRMTCIYRIIQGLFKCCLFLTNNIIFKSPRHLAIFISQHLIAALEGKESKS